MLIRRCPAVLFTVLASLITAAGTGCTQNKLITIATRPPGAVIKIDKVEQGRSPLTWQFDFRSDRDYHVVTAIKAGFTDATEMITGDDRRRHIVIDLKPLARDVAFTVSPVPAYITIDGKRVTREPVTFFEAKKLDFTIDPKTNTWTTHTVVAERPGYRKDTKVVSWIDQVQTYELKLQPMEKDVAVTTTPPGAQVYIDDKLVGTTAPGAPAVARGVTFQVDENNQFETHRLKAVKPGYDPVEREFSWDDGAQEYGIELVARNKEVHIATDPPGAAIKLNGNDLTTDPSGTATVKLPFTPDDKGNLPTFNGVATKTGDKDFLPTPFSIGWDDGRRDYTVKLKEVPSRPIPLLTARWMRGDDGWEVSPEIVQTIAARDTGEGPSKSRPVLLTRVPEKLPAGSSLDAFAVSPDGRQMLFTVLTGTGKNDFHSQMYVIKTDRSPGIEIFTDGKSLDLTPTYTPGGESIFFSSNRAGKRMSIWQIASSGALPMTQKTWDTNDTWPSLDSDPQPKLYYESRIDDRAEPRLFSLVLGTSTRADMTRMGGGEPRVSPKNDQVLFSSANDKTDKRDLFLVPAAGGTAQKLTDTPEVDECNPVWNRDGSRIAFASDAGKDPEGRHNYDIWVMDVSDPKHPRQLTTNISRDDLPNWDPTGRFLYFRSNRGGEWGIWKIQVKGD